MKLRGFDWLATVQCTISETEILNCDLMASNWAGRREIEKDWLLPEHEVKRIWIAGYFLSMKYGIMDSLLLPEHEVKRIWIAGYFLNMKYGIMDSWLLPEHEAEGLWLTAVSWLLPEHEAEGLWLTAYYLSMKQRANDWLVTTWTTLNRLPFSYSTTNLHIGGREILGLVWTFLLALFTSTRLPSTSHPFSSWMITGHGYQDPNPI
jgi:hypothetical protein